MFWPMNLTLCSGVKTIANFNHRPLYWAYGALWVCRYPRQTAGTNFPTPRGWIAGLARTCVYYMICLGSLHDQIQTLEQEFNPGSKTQDPARYQWTTRAAHYRLRIKSQKTARSAVGVEPTTFRTPARDDDKDITWYYSVLSTGAYVH